MDTATLEAVKAEVGSIRAYASSLLEQQLTPMVAEQERMARAIVEAQNHAKEARRQALLNSIANSVPLVPSGKYKGFTPSKLAVARAFQRAIAATPEAQSNPITRTMLEQWKANLAAAMDSTTSSSGDELVDTREMRDLWMDVNLQAVVASLIREVDMPSNPFDIPTQLGSVNFYPGTQNVAATETALSTAKKTLTAYELVGAVPWSYDLDEDSVIAMMEAVMAQLTRDAADILDDVVLNADTTAANGINSDGATIAATDAGKGQWLLGFDGLIHAALIDNTAMAVDHNAAISMDAFNEARRKMGKYAVRPSETAFVLDIATYLIAQTLSGVQTLDTFGPQATILTGQLGSFEGIPIVVPEKMLKADTDGKVTDAGNSADTGRILCFNRSQWIRGSKRALTLEVVPEPLKRQTTVVVSFRTALVQRDTLSAQTHTAIIYDITGI